MEEKDKNLIKLACAILAQAVIDTYLGSRNIRKKAVEWFHGDGFLTIANILKQSGIKPQDMFDLQCSWGDIPALLSKRGELLYVKCKAVNYLEGTEQNKYVLGRVRGKGKRNLMKISTRKKKHESAIQLVSDFML